MDSRDFRKKWLQLQESWTEEANVNVNATKAEKLDEKRKLPDALKAHQFGKKSEKGAEEKKDDKGPEKDKKEETKTEKKAVVVKKKATEGKKKVVVVKKVKEDGSAAGGSTTSAAVGGAKGVCPDAHIGSTERLQKRKKPELVTAKESKLFNHFKKFMAEAGLPLAPEAELEAPVNDVAADAVGELTGEEPVVDPAVEAPADDAASVLADIQARFPGMKIRICVEADPTAPFSEEDVAAAEAAIAAVPEEVEAPEAPEAPEVDAAAAVAATGEVDPETMGEGERSMSPEELADVRNGRPVRTGKVNYDAGEDAGEEEEVKVESASMREDEAEDMGAADGVEEIPTGAEVGAVDAEGGEDLGGEIETETEAGSEASPEMLSMTPEQWTEFLASGGVEGVEGEEGLGDELGGADVGSAEGEGDDSDSESSKSPDTLG